MQLTNGDRLVIAIAVSIVLIIFWNLFLTARVEDLYRKIGLLQPAGKFPTIAVMRNYTCSNDSLVGDINNDGFVTEADVNITALMGLGQLPLPGNLCCIDFNNDSAIDVHDIRVIDGMVEGTVPYNGTCAGYVCRNDSIIGDIDGDKRVTMNDVNVTVMMTLFTIEKPSNVCCIDLNGDGAVNLADVLRMKGIADGIDSYRGRCA